MEALRIFARNYAESPKGARVSATYRTKSSIPKVRHVVGNTLNGIFQIPERDFGTLWQSLIERPRRVEYFHLVEDSLADLLLARMEMRDPVSALKDIELGGRLSRQLIRQTGICIDG